MSTDRTPEQLAPAFAAVNRLAAAEAESAPAPTTTLLHLGDEHLVVLSGTGNQPEATHVLDIGAARIARTFFRLDLPTSGEIERAIDFVEDEIMRLGERAGAAASVWSTSAAWQAWATVSGPTMSLETVEDWFQRLASASLGQPAAMQGLPAGREAAASLLVLREIMHHRGYASVTLTPP